MASSGYQPLKVVYHRSGTDARTRHRTELDSRTSSLSTVLWNYKVNGRNIFVNIIGELSEDLETIWQKDLKIQKHLEQLSDTVRADFLRSLLVDEIRATNEIEGIKPPLEVIAEAVQLAESSTSSSGSTIPFQGMAQTYLRLLDTTKPEDSRCPSTIEALRVLYDDLLGEEITFQDRPDGKLFRKESVSVTDGMKVIHRGAFDEESINDGLRTMISTQQESEHTLVNAMAGHFIFEHVHPFYDGNGRLGRFLLSLRLSQLLSIPVAVSVSSAILQHVAMYYKAFRTAEEQLNSGELTFFVLDMSKILLTAIDEVLNSLVKISTE